MAPPAPAGGVPAAPLPVSPWLRAHLLVFPPSCRACGALLSPLAGWGAPQPPGWPHLCVPCHAALPWWPAEDVPAAAPATPSAVPPTLPGVDRVLAACRYEAPVNGWIRQLKYGRRDGLVRLLADLLPPAAAHGSTGTGTTAEGTSAPLVVPVPLHRRRLWQRGFNQSLLLARAWQRMAALRARAAGVPVPVLAPRLLVRHRYTPPQVRMSADERRANVADAFSLHGAVQRRGATPLAGRAVLLVDDVVTTGATLTACAAVLRRAGAASVQALVVAAAET